MNEARQAGGVGGTAVITPDAVGLELPIATVGSRGIAYLLDLLVLVAGLFVIGIMTAVLGGGGFVPGWAGIAVLLLLAFAWQFGYPIGFEVGARGRTPGKMAMGLRVVTIEGAPVGIRHAVIRALIATLELLATFGAGAVISSLVSRRGQRLGDLAAGTMVVRERRIGGAPQASVFVPPPGLEAYTDRLDVSSIGSTLYSVIRDTLRRAPQLPPSTREHITRRVADQVLTKVTPPPPSGVPPEPWLWCVAAAVQRRRHVAPHPPAAGESQPTPPGTPARQQGPPPPTPPRPSHGDDGFAPPG